MKRIRRAGRFVQKWTAVVLTLGLGLGFLLPIFFLLSGSLADSQEWTQRLAAMNQGSGAYILWKWIPDYPTGENFERLLLRSPAFLELFWNSVGMTTTILLGQLLVGVPGAWAFAVFRFPGRKVLFALYVILMLLPFQVTMLSRYLSLDRLGLLDTRAAVVLPAAFSTFPVFLIYRSFLGIPQEFLEAARIDGAGEWRLFTKIGLPLAQGGVMSAMTLGFLECWNMIEEPLAFIKDQSKWPLSLYLPQIGIDQAGFAGAASTVTLCLSLLVFALFADSLEKGIVASGLK